MKNIVGLISVSIFFISCFGIILFPKFTLEFGIIFLLFGCLNLVLSSRKKIRTTKKERKKIMKKNLDRTNEITKRVLKIELEFSLKSIIIDNVIPILFCNEYIQLATIPYSGDLLCSNLGGDIFWPRDLMSEWPKKNEDEDSFLIPIAQINLSDFESTKKLPKEGILQFFLDISDEEGYGSFDDNYKVIYWSKDEMGIDRDNCVSIFSFLKIGREKIFKSKKNNGYIYEKPFSLKGTKRIEELEKFYNQNGVFDFSQYDEGQHHKLLGLDTPTQPVYGREYNISEYILLFQIDSQVDKNRKTLEINWWDAGSIQFYIHPKDLQKLNFEKVFCYISGC